MPIPALTPGPAFRKPVAIFIALLLLPAMLCSLPSSSPPDSTAFRKAQQFLVQDPDSSIYYFNRAALYFSKGGQIENYLHALNGKTAAFYYKGDFESAVAAAEEALAKSKNYLDSFPAPYSGAINNIAAIIRERENYRKSERYLLEAIEAIKDKEESSQNLANYYHNLGTINMAKGDYESAYLMLQKALTIRKDHLPASDPTISRTYFELGYYWKKVNQPDSSLWYLNKALATIQSQEGQFQQQLRIDCYQTISSLWIDSMRLDLAREYAQKAFAVHRRGFPYRIAFSYDLLSRIDQKQGNWSAAVGHALRSVEETRQVFGEHTFHEVIFLRQAGDIYFDQGHFEKAIDYYQQALQTASAQFTDPDWGKNPPIKDIIHPRQALEAAENKAKALLEAYHTEPSRSELLQAAYETILLAVDILQENRRQISAEVSKNKLAGRALPVYELAIRISLALYELRPDPALLETAFYIAENNKASLLLEALRETAAKGITGSGALVEELENLEIDMAFYRKKINQEKARESQKDQEKINRWELSLLDLSQEAAALRQRLASEYPAYRRIKEQMQIVNAASIRQEILSPDQAILEFFVGESDVFLFVLSRQGLRASKVGKKDQWQQMVFRLKDLIENPDLPQEQQDPGFSSLAYELYAGLLEGALNGLADACTSLIIIPDDFLGFIPFDLFLTEPPSSERPGFSAANLAYLLEQYDLQYHYSSSLLYYLHNSPGGRTARKNLLGIAPNFEEGGRVSARSCADGTLSGLQCNTREVKNIQGLLSQSKAMLAEAATSSYFIEQAPGFQVLHLATHACFDETNPLLSKIYFSDDHLTLYDLFPLKLNAQLAVLSACNTGSGKLVRGEGIISLARGFMQAGCPSVVMSLWAVDDCATSDIMIDFYRHLKKGDPKHQALKKAKLNYLLSADKVHQHPYYWAAFLPIGNTTPLHLKGASPWYLWAGLGALVIIAFWFLGKTKTVWR